MYFLASSLRGFASSGRSLAPGMRSNLVVLTDLQLQQGKTWLTNSTLW
jgi:hypothetical protein